MSTRPTTMLSLAALCWTFACDPGNDGDVDRDGPIDCPTPSSGNPVPFCPEGDTDADDLRTPETDGDEETTGDGDTGGDTDAEIEDADLPYNFRVELGDQVLLEDAFLQKGAPPAAIIDVVMPDGNWRLAELAGEIPFVVDQADCDHEGNRDIGRDRIWVTWQNGDGSIDEDHMTIRYCGH
jgi:hypothetical protein